VTIDIKNPAEITDEVLAGLDLGEGTVGTAKSIADLTHAFRSGWLNGEAVRSLMALAIEADRAQRADYERFGQFAYETLDGAEWSSDTLQALGDFATFVLKKPFRDPFGD
jgi:hypothetical protein